MKKIIIFLGLLIMLASFVSAAWNHNPPLYYWDFDGVYTQSGNASLPFELTPGNNPSFVPGKIAQGINLTHNSIHYLKMENNASLELPTVKTITYWYNPKQFFENYVFRMIDLGNGADNLQYLRNGVSTEVGDNTMHFAMEGTGTTFSANTATTVGQWYHVILIINSTNNSIYINGNLFVSGLESPRPPDLVLGSAGAER